MLFRLLIHLINLSVSSFGPLERPIAVNYSRKMSSLFYSVCLLVQCGTTQARFSEHDVDAAAETIARMLTPDGEAVEENRIDKSNSRLMRAEGDKSISSQSDKAVDSSLEEGNFLESTDDTADYADDDQDEGEMTRVLTTTTTSTTSTTRPGQNMEKNAFEKPLSQKEIDSTRRRFWERRRHDAAEISTRSLDQLGREFADQKDKLTEEGEAEVKMIYGHEFGVQLATTENHAVNCGRRRMFTDRRRNALPDDEAEQSVACRELTMSESGDKVGSALVSEKVGVEGMKRAQQLPLNNAAVVTRSGSKPTGSFSSSDRAGSATTSIHAGPVEVRRSKGSRVVKQGSKSERKPAEPNRAELSPIRVAHHVPPAGKEIGEEVPQELHLEQEPAEGSFLSATEHGSVEKNVNLLRNMAQSTWLKSLIDDGFGD